MGNLVAGNKTALLSAVTDLQTKIQALGTSWATLVAAEVTARTLDDGTVYFGATGAYPSGRLDDVMGVDRLARIATQSMLSNGLRPVLEAFNHETGTGTADIVALVTSNLTGH